MFAKIVGSRYSEYRDDLRCDTQINVPQHAETNVMRVSPLWEFRLHSIRIHVGPLWAPIIQVVYFSWHLSVICQSSTKHTIPFVACPLSSLRPQTVRPLHSNRLLALARTKSMFTHFLLAHLLLLQFLLKAHHSRFMFALFFPFCPQKHTFSFGVDIFPFFLFGSVCLHMLHIESDILTTHFSYFSQVFIHTVVFGPLHFLSILGSSFGRPCCLCELWQVHTTLAKTPRRVSFPFL